MPDHRLCEYSACAAPLGHTEPLDCANASSVGCITDGARIAAECMAAFVVLEGQINHISWAIPAMKMVVTNVA